MTPPVTFIALDHANVDAVREVLRGLPREGIYLRRGQLLLETSYLGPGARDVYATAWSYALGDVPLFLTLSSHGRLLMTVAERVIVGVDKHSPWITKEELEESIVDGEVIVVTESAELAYWLRLT